MVPPTASSAQKLGYWSAIACTVLSLGYIVLQLFEWLGMLGSEGGSESASTPLGLALLLTPSLLLGSSFLALMVSVHHRTPEPRRVWSHAGVAFATVYAVLTGMVYFIQLTLVGPRMARGELAGIEFLVFTPFDSFLYAVDILGYSFMSVATLFAAFALSDAGVERVARRFMIANGLILPFLAFQMYWHSLIWIAALWAITFPGATLALATLFGRAERTPAAPAAVPV